MLEQMKLETTMTLMKSLGKFHKTFDGRNSVS
jgi:hypothetical protein